MLIRPLILVHGLWNTPNVFRRLESNLEQPPSMVFAPFLPHGCGRKDIRSLAKSLGKQIDARFGFSDPIDLLGFSMGGLISRVWLQEMMGFERTIRFFSIGSPHQGTYTAQLVPDHLFAGIAEMKNGSDFLKSLNVSSNYLQGIECRSYFTHWDLMAFPGYRSVLPFGSIIPIPVLTHKGLIKNFNAINLIASDILGRSVV